VVQLLVRSKHHIKPRSRRRAKSKIKKEVYLPGAYHEAMHIVFGNLFGEEQVIFISRLHDLMMTKDEITGDDIKLLQERIKSMNLFL
jgi:hypothetical protein